MMMIGVDNAVNGELADCMTTMLLASFWVFRLVRILQSIITKNISRARGGGGITSWSRSGFVENMEKKVNLNKDLLLVRTAGGGGGLRNWSIGSPGYFTSGVEVSERYITKPQCERIDEL